MSVLYIKNQQGTFESIPTIRGEKGEKGDKGDPGAGLQISGEVNTYADLPGNLGPEDAGAAYIVRADSKLYIWTGSAWPQSGQGSQFVGPQGPQGPAGQDYDPTVLNDYVSKADFASDVKIAASYPARGIFISASEPSGTIPQGCIWAVIES